MLAAAQLGEDALLAALEPLADRPSLDTVRAQRELARLGRLLGKEDAAPLLEMLAAQPHPAIRCLAAWALPDSWASVSLDLVETLARDRSVTVRDGLRLSLQDLPADLRWQLVRAWIGDQQARLKNLAVALVPPQPPADALAALEAPAAAQDPDLRAAALESLRRIAEADIEATLGALGEWAATHGASACWTLARALSQPPLVHEREAAMGILESLARSAGGDRACTRQLIVALRALARRHGVSPISSRLEGWAESPEAVLRRLARRAAARLPEG